MVITFFQDNMPGFIDCQEVEAVFSKVDRTNNMYYPFQVLVLFKSGSSQTFCYKDKLNVEKMYKAILDGKNEQTTTKKD